MKRNQDAFWIVMMLGAFGLMALTEKRPAKAYASEVAPVKTASR